ncbi:hypothetical protein NIES4074_12180 [Cylindrospermum sp. NIES-4074]|nr:hypothetical protein NIES4074_12180 [Cylindrospermum sp. NIES-4074]
MNLAPLIRTYVRVTEELRSNVSLREPEAYRSRRREASALGGFPDLKQLAWGSQGTPLGGSADLKEVPPRCSNWRDAEK